ncbi:chitinase N-terminal domain-containing protein [Chitinilyticum piscinae]|uniref:Chitinase A N-terminal domain-containing protein n=1 Tax=Chitinilyticum piscinae TaxID=2866724 RepID=A0A8J7K8F1_9NEIS|nr:chitinase N-terminal domain-containing protein [Chitinilyticum piscinae]MBE9609418.1 hypothetical protein [Chitinilyticum piscinae]
MTPAEAEKLGDRLCTPTSNGLLNCTVLAAPPVPAGNAPEIKPLPQAQFSESFGPVTSRKPALPLLDPLPPRLEARTVSIGWDIGYGTPGEYWEIWDNGEMLLRSRQFQQRDLSRQLGKAEREAFEMEMLAVQSGVQTLDKLADGRHEFEVRLCNRETDGKETCTSAFATTWVGDQGSESDSQNEGLPSPPELGWFPQINTGEAFQLEWHMWWGKTGSYWQVVIDGKVSSESRVFTENTPNSQAGMLQMLGMQPGKHQISVRLCNQLLCAESPPASLEVLLPSEEQLRPLVTIERGTVDSMLLLWSIPQYRLKQQPRQWRLLDGAGATEITEPASLGSWQKQVRLCQVGDRARPGVTVNSYCGEIRVPAASAPETIQVEVCPQEGDCLQSTPRSVSQSVPKR